MSLSTVELTGYWEGLRPQLVGHARTHVGDADLAEDLAQDCIQEALESLSTFRRRPDPQNVRAWLIGILDNLCLMSRRRQASEFRAKERLAEHLRSQATAFQRGALYDTAIALIRLSDLSPRQSLILRRRIEGHTQRAIAAQLRLDHSTIRHHIESGIQAIRLCPYSWMMCADLDAVRTKSPQLITRYHRPQRTGAGLARQQLARLK